MTSKTQVTQSARGNDGFRAELGLAVVFTNMLQNIHWSTERLQCSG